MIPKAVPFPDLTISIRIKFMLQRELLFCGILQDMLIGNKYTC